MSPEAIPLATEAANIASRTLPMVGPDGAQALLGLFLTTVFVSNIALSNFLGMCPLLTLSRRWDTAIGMGGAVTLVTVITAGVNWILHYQVLIPLHAEFLEFLVFILSTAAVVQILETLVRKVSPTLYEGFGLFLPLITVNCAVLGVSLFMIQRQYSLAQSLVFALGGGVGWTLAMALLACLRFRLAFSRPLPWLGEIGTSLILMGMLSLGFIAAAQLLVG